MASTGVELEDLKYDARLRPARVSFESASDFEIITRLWLFDDPNLAEPIPWDYNNDGRINMIDFAEYSKIHESYKSRTFYIVQPEEKGLWNSMAIEERKNFVGYK